MSHKPEMTLATIAQHVGETFFTSPWMTIDEQHLSQFAYSTYLDPDHADLTASKNNPLGSTLVDGFLLTSMLTMFHFNNSPVREPGIYGFNYGMDRVRFTHPVFVGEELRCVATLEKVDVRPDGRVLVTTNYVIELKHTDKPAMVATWVTLFATLDSASEA